MFGKALYRNFRSTYLPKRSSPKLSCVQNFMMTDWVVKAFKRDKQTITRSTHWDYCYPFFFFEDLARIWFDNRYRIRIENHFKNLNIGYLLVMCILFFQLCYYNSETLSNQPHSILFLINVSGTSLGNTVQDSIAYSFPIYHGTYKRVFHCMLIAIYPRR